MDFESLVGLFLARNGYFISPQFPLIVNGKEWSCPDFLALNFKLKRICIVEVTTAAYIKNIVKRVLERENYWYKHIDKNIINLGLENIISWQKFVFLFIRADQFDKVKQLLNDPLDVKLFQIDDIALPWKWNWGEFPQFKTN